MIAKSSTGCPHCKATVANTVIHVPFVGGFPGAPKFATKRLVGCLACVRQHLLLEVGACLRGGWQALASFSGQFCCFVWNAARLPFVAATPHRMERLLGDLGATPDHVDVGRIAVSLAAAMIAADGHIHDEEVETAISLGRNLIDGFAPEQLIESLENIDSLPSAESLAGLLADRLDDKSKAEVMAYLLAIASADRYLHDSEMRILQDAATAMGAVLPEIG